MVSHLSSFCLPIACVTDVMGLGHYTDDTAFHDRPTPASRSDLSLFLPNVLDQRPNHFRAMDEFPIERLEFHINP
jgi:hypothetical protein